MRVVQKTEFSEMTALELIELETPIAVQSHGKNVGVFLSIHNWQVIKGAISIAQWPTGANQRQLGFDAAEIVDVLAPE